MIKPSSDSTTFIVSLLLISIARLCLAGVYRSSLASRLPKSLFGRILAPKFLTDDKKRKLHENVYYTIWHTLSFIIVLLAVSPEPWFRQMIASRDSGWSLYGWPHAFTHQETSLYMFELAFWVSCLLFMAVETVRKDFKEMLLHHIATIALISISYKYGFIRIGYVVLLVHDVGDIFLYSAKSFNYLKFERTTNILFGAFVVVFFVSRLVLFTFVLRSAWLGVLNYYPEMNRTVDKSAVILPLLLAVLQILHYMWFGLILRMIYRMVFMEKNSQKDSRSDDESDSEKSPVRRSGKKKSG